MWGEIDHTFHARYKLSSLQEAGPLKTPPVGKKQTKLSSRGKNIPHCNRPAQRSYPDCVGGNRPYLPCKIQNIFFATSWPIKKIRLMSGKIRPNFLRVVFLFATSRPNEMIQIKWGENRPYLSCQIQVILCKKPAQRNDPDHVGEKYTMPSLQDTNYPLCNKLA